MTNNADARRLLAELERIDGAERSLEDRLRRMLTALIFARETHAHLQRLLHALDGRADGRLSAAQAADDDAQRYRDLLMSIQTEPEQVSVLPIPRSGSSP